MPPGALDENAPHGFRRRREELCATGPTWLVLSGQAQPGFMNQRGGLESVAGTFARHLVRGQPAQFVIDERQQLLGGLGLALLDGFEDARDVAHKKTCVTKLHCGISIPFMSSGVNTPCTPGQGGLYLLTKGLEAGELKAVVDKRVSFCFSGVDAPEAI